MRHDLAGPAMALVEPRPKWKWPMLAMRLLLGGVFLVAGWLKLRAPRDFADAIATFRLLPDAAVNPLAMVLPPFELLLGAWLLTGWRPRPAAFCASVTLCVFLGALVSARLRGLPVECGCFSATLEFAHNPWLSLVRDSALAAMALLLYWRQAKGEAGYAGPD